MGKYSKINIDVNVSDFIEDVDTEDLQEELKRRNDAAFMNTTNNNIEQSQIVEWFESPFISDYDKAQVLNKIYLTIK